MVKLTAKKSGVIYSSEGYSIAHLSRMYVMNKNYTAECDGYEWNGKEFIKIVEVKKKATKKDADKGTDIKKD